MSKQRGSRAGDQAEDTFDRATKMIDTVEFRVDTEAQLESLGRQNESLRRWAFVLVALLVLNWLHDLGATAEMLDWWDGRDYGFLSTEIEHEITVLTPLLLALIPILWGRHRDRLARKQQQEEQT